MHGPGWWHGAGMWFWWIVLILAIAGVIWAFSTASRRMGSRPGPGPEGETPEAILKKRYARGEIDRDTYERQLRELRA